MLQSASSGIQVKQTVFHLSLRHTQKRIESFWDSRHALFYEFPCQVQDKNPFIGFNEVRRLSGVVSFTWRLWKGFFQQTLFTIIRPQQSLKLKCNMKKHASDLFVCVVRRFLQRKLALFSLKCEPCNVVASLVAPNHLLASRYLWRSKDYEALTGKEFQSPEMLWHKSDLPSVEANSFQCRTVCAWHAPISQQWNPGQKNSFSLVPSAYPKTDWIFLRFKACTLLWVSMSSAGQESVHWFQWSKKAIWCSIIYLETLERLLPTNAFHNH